MGFKETLGKLVGLEEQDDIITEEEMDTLVSFLERMNSNLKAFAKEDENV